MLCVCVYVFLFWFGLYIYIQQKEYWKFFLILIFLIHSCCMCMCLCAVSRSFHFNLFITYFNKHLSFASQSFLPISCRAIPIHIFLHSLCFACFLFKFHRYSLILINPYTFIHLD